MLKAYIYTIAGHHTKGELIVFAENRKEADGIAKKEEGKNGGDWAIQDVGKNHGFRGWKKLKRGLVLGG